MKNKKNSLLAYSSFLIGFLLMLSIGCTRDEAAPTPNPVVPTAPTTVTDADGNVYHTVTIGTQVWMVENLKTTKYRNGDPIPIVSNNSLWNGLTTGAYCDYDTDPNNSVTYGKLYNWYAATDSRNIAPAGWHLPTDAEWTTLENYLGGKTIAGGKRKETGATHSQSPNTGATNETGFKALPGGTRMLNGVYSLDGFDGWWWSSTISTAANAWGRTIPYDNIKIDRNDYYKKVGLSVRCIYG